MTFPPDFTYPTEKQALADLAAQSITGLARGHRGVVQAGGCSGLWPVALSRTFAHVWTCEPAPSNWPSLAANIAGTPNIRASAVALGAAPASVGLTRLKPKAGLWRVEGTGDIPMTTIDALVGDAPVDAIVLDVEGHEAEALRGAARTITTHRPVVWVECLHDHEGITQVLAAYGYHPPRHALGGDGYSEHASHAR